jgi:hypothetical protein
VFHSSSILLLGSILDLEVKLSELDENAIVCNRRFLDATKLMFDKLNIKPLNKDVLVVELKLSNFNLLEH